MQKSTANKPPMGITEHSRPWGSLYLDEDSNSGCLMIVSNYNEYCTRWPIKEHQGIGADK